MVMDEEYKATAAEKKLLEALSEPENYTLSITELCGKAGIGRNTYYTLLKKPEFVAKKNEIEKKVFDSLVPEVKRAAVKFAINNSKNFQDRKMILEMAGEYVPKQEIKSNVILSEEEIDRRLKEFDSGD